MRRKDKNLIANLKKKKKREPYQGRAIGGVARHRADRLSTRHRDPEQVRDSDLADGDPGRPYEPNAPVGGAMRQRFKKGGWIGPARESMERRGTVGSLHKAMGVPQGDKIPTGSLEAKKAQAKRTGNTKMMKKVNFALNVRK